MPISPFDDEAVLPTPDPDDAPTPPSYPQENPEWSAVRWQAQMQRATRRATRGAILAVLILGPLAGWGYPWAQAPGRLPAPTWWGLWAGWGLLLLATGALMGGHALQKHLTGRPSVYDFPMCKSQEWLGREAWRVMPWASVMRRWCWGGTLATLPLVVLVIAAVMTLVSGLQALLIAGVHPALNLHHAMAPMVLREDGVSSLGLGLLLLVNLELPLVALCALTALCAQDHARQAHRLWEGWTLYPTRHLRAQSPTWNAVLNEDWDGVLGLSGLVPLDHDRRSAMGGSLLTQAVLLKAPAGVLQHLIALGCDPEQSWLPWHAQRSLDDWVRDAVVTTEVWPGQSSGQTMVRPRASWPAPAVDVTWPLTYLQQMIVAMETVQLRAVVRATLAQAEPNPEPLRAAAGAFDDVPDLARRTRARL